MAIEEENRKVQKMDYKNGNSLSIGILPLLRAQQLPIYL